MTTQTQEKPAADTSIDNTTQAPAVVNKSTMYWMSAGLALLGVLAGYGGATYMGRNKQPKLTNS